MFTFLGEARNKSMSGKTFEKKFGAERFEFERSVGGSIPPLGTSKLVFTKKLNGEKFDTGIFINLENLTL